MLASAVVDSGAFVDGDAVGRVPVHLVSGIFEAGELLRIDDVTHARSTGTATIGGLASHFDRIGCERRQFT